MIYIQLKPYTHLPFGLVALAVGCAPSWMMIPSIQQFVRKKANEAAHRPGKNVLIPRNSRLYP